MTAEQVECLLGLLARAKAAWIVSELRTLVEAAESPSKAYDLVLEKTGKRKKALAARWFAIAMRDFNPDIVGAAVRFLGAVPHNVDRLRALLITPDDGQKENAVITREWVRQCLQEQGLHITHNRGGGNCLLRMQIKAEIPHSMKAGKITVCGYYEGEESWLGDWRTSLHIYLFLWGEDSKWHGTDSPPFNGGCSCNVTGEDAFRGLVKRIAAGEFLPNDSEFHPSE